MTKEAHLVLADGTRFSGTSFGATGVTTGEAVFTTGMTGYEEVLTDPSYCGQIVTMTAPQIGNTGINIEDGEARSPALRGFVVRELSAVESNWRSKESLHCRCHQQPAPRHPSSSVDRRELSLHTVLWT